LFDARRCTRSLESAYLHIHERQQAGLPPEHATVQAAAGAARA
jgi:hypothetical protein